jgi:hypothetical protein
MTMALTAAACGSAALGAGAGAVPTQHIADDASPDDGVETTDRPPDQPAIVVTATSPEHVQFSTEVKEVVLLAKPPGPARAHRKARVREGMMIGAAVGVLAGVLAGAEDDSRADVSCGGGCQAILGSAVSGAIGLGLGAAAGGIIGRFEDP